MSLYQALNNWCFETVKCCTSCPRTFNRSALPSPKAKILGMSNHTCDFHILSFCFIYVYGREIHTEYKRGHQIKYLELELHTVVNQCGFWKPTGLLKKKKKKGNTLNLQANSLAPSKLTCNEIWNQLLWTMTVPLLNAGTLLIQLNSFPYISWVAYIVQHCPPSPAASSIQILWNAGIPSTESLLTINSMQFCPKGSGLGVGAQRGAREPLLLGKGKGLYLCSCAEAIHVGKNFAVRLLCSHSCSIKKEKTIIYSLSVNKTNELTSKIYFDLSLGLRRIGITHIPLREGILAVVPLKDNLCAGDVAQLLEHLLIFLWIHNTSTHV